jgi:hypothetical protein
LVHASLGDLRTGNLGNGELGALLLLYDIRS